MDSSVKTDEKKKDSNKRFRRSPQELSSQVEESNNSNGATSTQGDEVQEQLPPPLSDQSTVLNDLPSEIIDLIADKVPIKDRLHWQNAFVNDPEQAVANIQEGLKINLAKQRGLYLLMDLDPYDAKYQYNYRLTIKLPNALLPALEELPIQAEAFKLISLHDLQKEGSLGSSPSRLKQIFPNLQELKIVLRKYSIDSISKLFKTMAVFSRQLTSLQLYIFSSHITEHSWSIFDLFRLICHLNICRFDRLRHFTLIYKDVRTLFSCLCNLLKPLNLLSTVEECYLRLPSAVIEHQLGLLGSNERLKRLGLISNYFDTMQTEIGTVYRLLLKTSPALASKIVHLLFTGGYWSQGMRANDPRLMLRRLGEFTSLTTFRCSLTSIEAYVELMKTLRSSGSSLRYLEISLHYNPVKAHTFKGLAKLSPLSSVTHLILKVTKIVSLTEIEDKVEFSHQIFIHLNVVWQFANLRKLEVTFPQSYRCSLCEITSIVDREQCVNKSLKPFQALVHLKEFLFDGDRKELHT